MSYWILAYYAIQKIEDPKAEVARHKEFLNSRDFRGRIYISEQGINGQSSGSVAHAREYIEWVRSLGLANFSFKIHKASEHAFPRMTVKYRKQLVAIDCEVDLSKRGESVSSIGWKTMMEQRTPETLLLDVRNDYEWKVGHFEGAELPCLEQFRQFPEYAKKLKEQRDPAKTLVMMYCTGGIRCEFYSALLNMEGFKQVYHLEGGVIQYGLEQGSDYWKGKLFVFDDRLVIPLSEKGETIASCIYCKILSDVYYNCANMDCNALFFCCADCLQFHRGCCSEICLEGRVRLFRKNAKPFRKLRHSC